jgi:D-sedoheptulose 7-phosphate isomerase
MDNLMLWNDYTKALSKALGSVNQQDINRLIFLIERQVDNDNAVFIIGNGGSAYTASHFITDWCKMLNVLKKKRLKIYSLTDNVGMLTAYGNDLSYNKIFSEQLTSYARSEDLLLVVSGSGNSPNILEAIAESKKIGMRSYGLLGFQGGKAGEALESKIIVDSNDMQIIEDVHLSIGHNIMKCLCA